MWRRGLCCEPDHPRGSGDAARRGSRAGNCRAGVGASPSSLLRAFALRDAPCSVASQQAVRGCHFACRNHPEPGGRATGRPSPETWRDAGLPWDSGLGCLQAFAAAPVPGVPGASAPFVLNPPCAGCRCLPGRLTSSPSAPLAGLTQSPGDRCAGRGSDRVPMAVDGAFPAPIRAPSIAARRSGGYRFAQTLVTRRHRPSCPMRCQCHLSRA